LPYTWEQLVSESELALSKETQLLWHNCLQKNLERLDDFVPFYLETLFFPFSINDVGIWTLVNKPLMHERNANLKVCYMLQNNYKGVHLILVFTLKATQARALIKCLEAQFNIFYFKLLILLLVACGP
jgi:hypothetical protein